MAVLRDVRTVVMFVVDVTERAAEITESSATAPPVERCVQKRRAQNRVARAKGQIDLEPRAASLGFKACQGDKRLDLATALKAPDSG